MKKKLEKGITLIALIITIVVLLILAMVTIGAIQGDGIIKKAAQSSEEYEIAQELETIKLAVSELKIDSAINETKINAGNLQNKLADNKMEAEVTGETYLTVKVIKSGRYYTVDENGNVEGPIEKIADNTPGHISGEGTEVSPYLIESIEDLVTLSNKVNGTGREINSDGTVTDITESYNYDGEYVTLACDLDFKADISYIDAKRTDFGTEEELKIALTTGTGFKPIGTTKALMFKGTFDGNEKTISNLYINSTGNFVGLFGNTNTVKDLTLKNGNITGAGCVGGIAGAARTGKISNCHNINTSVTATNYTAAGICGMTIVNIEDCTNTGTIKSGADVYGESMSGGIVAQGSTSPINIINCINYGNVSADGSQVGGIVAYNKTCNIIECVNYGTIKSGSDVDGYSYCAGISGYNWSTLDTMLNITKCINYGEVDGEKSIGGVLGLARKINVSECENYGKVEGAEYVGGIVGILASGGVANSFNYGTVEGNKRVGGIIGDFDGRSAGKVTKCANFAVITSLIEDWAGGIVGLVSTDGKDPSEEEPVSISYCYNTGKVSSLAYSGGIVGGAVQYKTLIEKCYNTGEISGTYGTAGICAWGQRNPIIANCYNTGKISNATYSAGICARVSYSAGSIVNCYNIGEVETGTYTSGIVGNNSNNSTLENCYYLEGSVTLSEGNDAEADLAKSAEYIRTTFLTTANQTETIWEIVGERNNGYPVIVGME